MESVTFRVTCDPTYKLRISALPDSKNIPNWKIGQKFKIERAGSSQIKLTPTKMPKAKRGFYSPSWDGQKKYLVIGAHCGAIKLAVTKTQGYQPHKLTGWQQIDGTIIIDLGQDVKFIGIPNIKTKAKSHVEVKGGLPPQVPFRVEGIKGKVPDCIGYLNRCVDEHLINLTVDKTGHLRAAANIVIDGQGV